MNFANTAAEYSPLVLAYMGDAVYELLIREHIVKRTSRQVHLLHREAVHYVRAESQAEAVRALLPELSGAEAAVVRRGRNTHSNTVPKNASVIDYRMATGFEALIGCLWLSGEKERARELVERGMEILDAPGHGKGKARKEQKESDGSGKREETGE